MIPARVLISTDGPPRGPRRRRHRQAEEIARLAAGFFRGGETPKRSGDTAPGRCVRRRGPNSKEGKALSQGRWPFRRATRPAEPAAGEAVHDFRSPCHRRRRRQRADAMFNGSAGKARGFAGSGRLLQFRFQFLRLRKMCRASSSCGVRRPRPALGLTINTASRTSEDMWFVLFSCRIEF